LSATAEGSSATYGDDGSKELEDPGEPLSHSSKSPGPSSLRDCSEDDDDKLGPTAALGAIALHVAIAAVAGAKAVPIMDMPDSLEQPPAVPKLATPKSVASGGARSGRLSPRKEASWLRPSQLRNGRRWSRQLMAW
jgi:hypothetical protein